MTGHVPEGAAGLTPLGRLPGSQRLRLAIGLPLRNRPALERLIAQLCNPASANYRQWLTPEQFTERYGPGLEDYQRLADFVATNGLTVTKTFSTRMILDVAGAVTNIEKAFAIRMLVYQHPTENRAFYAPDVTLGSRNDCRPGHHWPG